MFFNFGHSGYSRLVRPVGDASEPVPAHLSVTLINIADVDSKNAAVTLRIWKTVVRGTTDKF